MAQAKLLPCHSAGARLLLKQQHLDLFTACAVSSTNTYNGARLRSNHLGKQGNKKKSKHSKQTIKKKHLRSTAQARACCYSNGNGQSYMSSKKSLLIHLALGT